MAEQQQNNVNTNKSFLDLEGLQKFWGIIKERAANSLDLGYTDNNGISLTLKNINGTTLGSPIVITAADSENPGLMTPDHVDTLTKLNAGVGLLDGIKFGPNNTAATVTDKFLNIDLRYQKSGEGDGTKHELQIIDYNKLVDITDGDGNPITDGDGNPIKEPTVLTSIDVAEFVKSGILRDSTLTESDGVVYLKLVFNTDTGTSDVLINVDDLITQYSAGDGLEIENVENSGELGLDNKKYSGKFKIKLANDVGTVDKPKNKYLSVDGDGLTTTDALDTAVKATTLQKDITISGGPLAEQLKTAFGDKIPAGKTLEQIITALALKIYDGSISGPTISWNPSINQPNLTIVGANGATTINKEIGETIGITYTPNTAISSNNPDNKPTRKYYFTDNNKYGIWATESADKIKWETDSDGNETNIPKFGEDGTKLIYIPNSSLSASKRYVSSSTSTSINIDNLKITGVSITKGSESSTRTPVANGETFTFELDTVGTNTITVTQGGATATGGAVQNAVACPANSLGECIYTGYKVLKGDTAVTSDKPKTIDGKSATVTINVKRACWFGAMQEIKLSKLDIQNNNIDGTYIRDNLSDIKTFDMNFSVPSTSLTVKKGDKQVIIATGKKIEKVWSSSQNTYITADIIQLKEKVTNNNTTTLTDYISIKGAQSKYPANYYVYVWIAATDSGFDDDTLTITYVK